MRYDSALWHLFMLILVYLYLYHAAIVITWGWAYLNVWHKPVPLHRHTTWHLWQPLNSWQPPCPRLTPVSPPKKGRKQAMLAASVESTRSSRRWMKAMAKMRPSIREKKVDRPSVWGESHPILSMLFYWPYQQKNFSLLCQRGCWSQPHHHGQAHQVSTRSLTFPTLLMAPTPTHTAWTWHATMHNHLCPFAPICAHLRHITCPPCNASPPCFHAYVLNSIPLTLYWLSLAIPLLPIPVPSTAQPSNLQHHVAHCMSRVTSGPWHCTSTMLHIFAATPPLLAHPWHPGLQCRVTHHASHLGTICLRNFLAMPML